MEKIRHFRSAPPTKWKKEPKKLRETDSNLLVLTVKAKVEEDMEPDKYDVLQFITRIKNYYGSWLLCKTKQEKDDFDECVNYIWNLLADFEKRQDYFLGIMETDFEKLNTLQKFYYAYIIFLHDRNNEMIEDNINECLENLIKSNQKQTIFKKLRKYNTYIMTWIELQNIDDDLNLDINYLQETVISMFPVSEDDLTFEEWDNN